jgi:exodeoxyribonuclease-3
MKIITWNVNGIRANIKKQKSGEVAASTAESSLAALIREHEPDFLCLQEVRSHSQADLEPFRSYGGLQHLYVHPGTRKGYSGTAILTKHKADASHRDFAGWPAELRPPIPADMLTEGRVLALEYPTYFVVTTYTPNSKPQLERLTDRQQWDVAWRSYLNWLTTSTGKAVIACGDLNVAHTELDIHTTKGKARAAGFTNEERTGFTALQTDGWVDTYRQCHPTDKKWSWWSNFANSRARGVGWRIDYVLVSAGLKEAVRDADCLNEYYGSDHCPVIASVDFS